MHIEPSKKVFAFRIGFVKPEKDFKNTVNLYNYLGWLYPIARAVSNNVCFDARRSRKGND